MIFLIAAVLCLCIMVGCGGNASTESSGTDTGSTASGTASSDTFSETESAVDPEAMLSKENVHYIADDGSSVYKVVYSGDNGESTAVASAVAKGMKDGLGINLKCIADTEDGTDQYEILIGDTNRPESREAIEYLYLKKMGRYADYIICTIGKKIVINGMSDDAVAKAAKYFVENYIKKSGIEGGIIYTYSTPGNFNEITVNGVDIYRFKFVRDNTNRSWLVQEEIRKVQDYIQETTGYAVSLEEDLKTTEAEYEINIGNTVRTVKPSSGFGYEDWEILVQGKKVYIAGGSTYAIQVAVTEFGKILQKNEITDADSKIGTYSETVAGYDSSTYYSLKWGDEFDGSELDTTKWIIRDGTNVGNNGNQVNLVKNDETFEMRDGNLIMKAVKRDDGGYDHSDAIKSDTSFKFNRGYLEMRARIPDGKGVYSSFWCNSSNGLELDIFESLGMAHTQRANIHQWTPKHTSLDGVVAGPDRQYVLEEGTLFDQYRTIGMYWDDHIIRFIYDGEIYYEQETSEYFDGQFEYIVAGFNVGWKGRTPPEEGLTYPLEYHIDYIRLFQVDGQLIKN